MAGKRRAPHTALSPRRRGTSVPASAAAQAVRLHDRFYAGDLFPGKYDCVDLLKNKRKKNMGEQVMYYREDASESIIDWELFVKTKRNAKRMPGFDHFELLHENTLLQQENHLPWMRLLHGMILK